MDIEFLQTKLRFTYFVKIESWFNQFSNQAYDATSRLEALKSSQLYFHYFHRISSLKLRDT